MSRKHKPEGAGRKQLITFAITVAIVTILGAFAAAVIWLVPKALESRWKEPYQKAFALRHKDADEAARLYKQAIANYDSAPAETKCQMHYRYGSLLFHQAERSEAKKQFALAKQLAEKSGEPTIAAESGEMQEWCDHFDFMRERTSEPPGTILTQKAIEHKLIKYGEKSKELCTSYYFLGNLQIDRREFQKAAEALTKAALIANHNRDGVELSRIYMSCVRLYLSQGTPEKAPPYFAAALQATSQLDTIGDALLRKQYAGLFKGSPSNYDEQLKKTALALLTEKKFDELDSNADTLRRTRSARPLGRWHLDSFYDGLDVAEGTEPDEVWQSRIKLLREWQKSKPSSITARVALADVLVSYAWRARGGGWGYEVTESGRQLFENRLAEARQLLEESHAQLKDDCPHWYTVMLWVGLGQGWSKDEYDKIFAEGVTKFPGYRTIFLSKSSYLLKRWHGQPGDLEHFAKSEADKLGGSAGDALYAQIVAAVQDYLGGNPFEEGPEFSWKRCQRGYQTLMSEFPDSEELQCSFARTALYAGDTGAALALLKIPVQTKQ